MNFIQGLIIKQFMYQQRIIQKYLNECSKNNYVIISNDGKRISFSNKDLEDVKIFQELKRLNYITVMSKQVTIVKETDLILF